MFSYNCFLYVIDMHNVSIHLYILLRLIYLLFSTLSITWRCEVGTDNWVQCNDAPVKICKYPVSGLVEGRSYTFRVRAVNSAGVSRPSRASEAVAALDPLDLKRLQGRSLRSQGPSVSCDLFLLFPTPPPPTCIWALRPSLGLCGMAESHGLWVAVKVMLRVGTPGWLFHLEMKVFHLPTALPWNPVKPVQNQTFLSPLM